MLYSQRYCFHRIIKGQNIALAMMLVMFCHFSKAQIIAKSELTAVTSADIKVGAERMEQYIDLLKGKNVAVVANQTSLVKNTLLVDTLLSLGIKITKIFAP